MDPGDQQPTRLLAFMNQKGGVGKTTTTVNLAAAFAAAGRPTLLIDLDPQAHATLHLGHDPEARGEGHADPPPTVYDLLTGSAPAEDCVHEARPNLSLIPAETDLAAAETELNELPRRQSRLADALAQIAPRFDFCLIDCPPSLGLLTVNALVAAREIFIPMQAHFLALQGMSKLLETVQLLRGNSASPGLNPKLRVAGVILCMHDKQSTHTQEVVADLEAFFGQAREQADSPWRYARVYDPAIRRNIKLAECPSFGQTIFDYAPDANGAADYQALAASIKAEWDEVLARRAGNAAASATPPQTDPPPQHEIHVIARSAEHAEPHDEPTSAEAS